MAELFKISGELTLIIYGKSTRDFKYIFYQHWGSFKIYNSYVEFSASIVIRGGAGMTSLNGIIPFLNVVPSRNYIEIDKRFKKKSTIEDYFVCFKLPKNNMIFIGFAANNGWEALPDFMKKYSGGPSAFINKRLISDNGQYQNCLRNSSFGQNLFLLITPYKKEPFDNFISFLRTVPFSNPPEQVVGRFEYKQTLV